MLSIALAMVVAGATIPVQVIDLQTEKAITAHVIAWDDFYWTSFHGSGNTCFRSAGIVATPPRAEIKLPPATPGSGPTHAQSLAFARGYCAVTPNAFVGFAHPDAPGGMVSLGGDAKGLKSGSPLTIGTRPSNDPAEYRLLYLAGLARRVSGACFEIRDRSFTSGMMKAILDEADSLPRTFHEKFLAQRVHEAAAGLDAPPHAPASIFKPLLQMHVAGFWPLDKIESSLETAKGKPFVPPWCLDGHCAGGVAPAGMLVPPDPYDIDLRDESGQTLLMQAAQEVNLKAVTMALRRGADPEVLDRPGGLNALDLVLLRAEQDVTPWGPEGAEIHLMRVIDALVVARSSLHPANRELLEQASLWKVDDRARAFWTSTAAKLSKVRTREAFRPTCTGSVLQVKTLKLGIPERQ